MLLAGGAFADDEAPPPMVLSSEHLGMTAEDFEAARAAEREARAKLEAEARAEAEQQVKAVTEEPLLLTAEGDEPESEWSSAPAGEGGPCAQEVAQAGGAIGFGECIERAIRAGNGFDESARICRAVFPESAAREQAPPRPR